MATATKRPNTAITKFLQDIVDDSKAFVDDLILRAKADKLAKVSTTK